MSRASKPREQKQIVLAKYPNAKLVAVYRRNGCFAHWSVMDGKQYLGPNWATIAEWINGK